MDPPGRGLAVCRRRYLVDQEDPDERGDLVLGERKRWAPEIHDLALPAQPFHAERQLRPRGDEEPEVHGSESDERLDEPPCDGRAGKDVDIVEHEEERLVQDALDRVGQERGCGVRPPEDAGVVGRLDGAFDRSGEIRRQVGQGDPERGDDAGRQRAEVAIARVERVPRRPPAAGDPGREGRLAESRPADDDRQAAVRSAGQALLENGPAQGSGRVCRREELGRPPDRRGPARAGPGDGVAIAGGVGRSIRGGGHGPSRLQSAS